MRIRLAIAAAAVAALAIAGCGGGSSTSTTTTAALSKSEFLAKGNAICAQGSKEIQTASQKAFPKNGPKPSQAELDKFATDTLIPNIQQQIDGIKALPPPPGDEDQVNAIVAAAQSGLDKAKENPSVLTSQEGSDPFAQADRLANSYGLTKCGSG